VRRPVMRAMVAGGALVGSVAAAVALERAAVRRARSRPDPERGTPLSERPGTERLVHAFDGTQLAVRVIGPRDAPTIVFAHGFSLDMTAWHYQWTHFSKRFRCVLLDHRGHGRSERAASGDYSLDALGRDVKAVLDAEVEHGPAVLVGHSMGGMAILSFAAQFPEEFGGRVRATVLADTGAADFVSEMATGLGASAARLLSGGARRLAKRPDRVHRIRSRAFAGRADLAFLIARATNFGPDVAPSVVDHVVEIAARAPVDVWSDLLVSLIEMDLRHALDHVQAPTLVVVGELDRLTPPSAARAMVRELPDARLVVIGGAGHCAMLERHERFNEELEGFLREALVG
jgi:pimeloyl-ACP methyl ester carboxylesterase